jgi:flagellar motor switch protein FliM
MKPTKKECDFANMVLDKVDKQLKEIWEAYRMTQYDVMRAEVEDAMKIVREEYK